MSFIKIPECLSIRYMDHYRNHKYSALFSTSEFSKADISVQKCVCVSVCLCVYVIRPHKMAVLSLSVPLLLDSVCFTSTHSRD